MSAALANAPVDPSLGEAGDDVLVAALRARDETAFLVLVRRYTPLMLHVARSRLGRPEVAEDVVQDTWIAVLRAIDGFEGRSSFKTWLLRILLNATHTRGRQESRIVCRATLPPDADAWDADLRRGCAVEPDDPERRAMSGEAWAMIERALGTLPHRQREVVVLRDVEGWTAAEVCDALGLSQGNQRILLHRGRARLRDALAPLVTSAARAPAPG